MATIAVGDIHGNLPALKDVLDQIRGEGGPGDTFVFLGDYIDRGPDTRGCVDAILGFQRQVEAEVVCLIGNHEDWLLRTLRDHSRHSWLLGMEALDTIRSYSVEAAVALREAMERAGAAVYMGRCVLPYEAFVDRVPAEHIRFFEGLRLYCQTVDCLCVHGGLDTRIADVQDQLPDALIWGAGDFPNGYEGAELVVYGHRNNTVLNTDNWPVPMVVGRTIGIDTISHGILTAIRLPDQRIYQSARYQIAKPDV
jgi:serine/threonine protein phosphatase 1